MAVGIRRPEELAGTLAASLQGHWESDMQTGSTSLHSRCAGSPPEGARRGPPPPGSSLEERQLGRYRRGLGLEELVGNQERRKVMGERGSG
jgi:hypothetical protein